MMESNANAGERTGRPVYAGDITDDDAVRILKEEGIWERLLDGKHTLRYIYSGLIEQTTLELDETAASLKEVDKDYESMDLSYVAFTLYPGRDAFEEWIEEGSPAFTALMRLMGDC